MLLALLAPFAGSMPLAGATGSTTITPTFNTNPSGFTVAIKE